MKSKQSPTRPETEMYNDLPEYSPVVTYYNFKEHRGMIDTTIDDFIKTTSVEVLAANFFGIKTDSKTPLISETELKEFEEFIRMAMPILIDKYLNKVQNESDKNSIEGTGNMIGNFLKGISMHNLSHMVACLIERPGIGLAKATPPFIQAKIWQNLIIDENVMAHEFYAGIFQRVSFSDDLPPSMLCLYPDKLIEALSSLSSRVHTNMDANNEKIFEALKLKIDFLIKKVKELNNQISENEYIDIYYKLLSLATFSATLDILSGFYNDRFPVCIVEDGQKYTDHIKTRTEALEFACSKIPEIDQVLEKLQLGKSPIIVDILRRIYRDSKDEENKGRILIDIFFETIRPVMQRERLAADGKYTLKSK